MDIDWIALDMDCLRLEVAYWIGSCIFLVDCIGLGCFNSRSAQNWVGLHRVGCVEFHICVALNDWIVWIEWISVGSH